jgi:hypothetical protein
MILQRLADQNAFVTALDAGRSWFRYHQLFADLLHLELRCVAPAAIPSLHGAAAVWHEDNGDVVEAVRHYQAAREWAPAARLLVDHYFPLTMAGRGETLERCSGSSQPMGICATGISRLRCASMPCSRAGWTRPRATCASPGDSPCPCRRNGGASSRCIWPS